jgi:hypothetical protein
VVLTKPFKNSKAFINRPQALPSSVLLLATAIKSSYVGVTQITLAARNILVTFTALVDIA